MIKQFIIATSALLLTTLSMRATAHTIEPDILFDKHTVRMKQAGNARDNLVAVPGNSFNEILGLRFPCNENKNDRMNSREPLTGHRSMNFQKNHDISWREASDNLLRNVNSMIKHKGYNRFGQWKSVAEITTDRFKGICIFKLYF